MSKVNLDWKTAENFCTDAFVAVGVPREEAKICTEILLEADKRGIESHGCNRFKPIYMDRIKIGIQNPKTNFEIIKETETTAVVDGHDGMGQVIGYKAMKMAIEKAKKYGMGMVVVRNSCHYGIAGYYGTMAAKAGCISINGTNARPSVAPTFGVEGMFGTNPMTIGIPSDEEFDFLIDCATSITQNGKIEYYARIGEPVHPGTIIDSNGNPVEGDAGEALKKIRSGTAALTTLGGIGEELGGYKGFGYAVAIEILSAALQDGKFGKVLNGLNERGEKIPYHLGHFFIAIDTDHFLGQEKCRKITGDILRKIRASKKMPGHDRIYTAGEKEYLVWQQRKDVGVPINKSVQQEMNQIRDEYHLNYTFPWEDGKEKEENLMAAVEICKKHNILLPTFKMLDDPTKIPNKVKEELKNIGVMEINPLNLFRISWFNEPKDKGGLYKDLPNYFVVPKQLTGIKADIVMIVGKYFPTGSHKVGASYGPLVTRLTTGIFNPKKHKALWPSTGNYCRGGAFNSALMHSPCIAVLPEDMSQERFDWLHSIGAEVYKTPGGESNVKEVFDMNNKLVREGKGSVMSFNQFSDFSNPIFHYWCTGRAIEKVFKHVAKPNQRLAGIHLTQGSAGAISGSAEYLRSKYPLLKVAAGEALQCPTLYCNGFGDHRIEGIGDKHVPWILNVKNLNAVIALDDEDVMRTMHLFNHEEGKKYLKEKGVPEKFIEKLPLLGISGIGNLLGCIKLAKMYEFNENDVICSVCTDSMDMYQSRVKEHKGEYTRDEAVETFARCILGQSNKHCLELTYKVKKRCHNLKYFTWKEQQGKTAKELNAQWYDDNYWKQYLSEEVVDKYDQWIMEFNKKTGLADKYGMK